MSWSDYCNCYRRVNTYFLFPYVKLIPHDCSRTLGATNRMQQVGILLTGTIDKVSKCLPLSKATHKVAFLLSC